ncbi:MAG TPA: hypothetical protein VKB14_13230, partial [Actinomycetales bacterium]|nr:hypothetical protein [Actinomycetales bacterium]
MVRLRRALAGMAVAFTPIAAIVAPGLASTAEATTPEVGFTADPLPTYQTNGIAWALAQAEGVVYVGGTFSAVRPPGSAAGVNESAASNFVALDATTGTPTGCQLAFTGPSSSVRALAVSPDQQTLYAAGLFSAVGGTPAQNFAAIDLTTCRPILSFRPQVGGWARSISVAPNGNVFIGGDFGTVNDQPRQRFAAFDPTGALLPWAPAAASNPKTDAATGVTTIPPSSGYAIAITPDGQSAAIGGAFDTINGADSHALAIVDTASGAVVRGYPNRSFASQASTVKTLFADSTGLYSGNEGTGFEVFDGRTALDLGTFNQRWRDWCFGATQSVLVERGNLYGASHAHDCNR